MNLVWASDDYKIASVAKPGFPIILNDDLTSCVEANKFLRYYLMRGAIGSSASWEPTARALYDYFSFLGVHELAWDDVDRGEEKPLVGAYRDYCFETARLKRNTVRQRVMYICEFYEWAAKQGWIRRLPFESEDRRISKPAGFLAHTDASGGQVKARSPMPRKHNALPKYLTRDERQSLIAVADNVHHRMLVRLALGSGLRRAELASFPAGYVFDPDRRPGKTRNVKIYLDPEDGSGMKTKGSKPRTIYITRGLMKDLHHYLKKHRGERAAEGESPLPLFLNQDGQPFADDGKGFERVISDLGKRVGLKVHPHMLRHTYATHTLAALQRQPGKRQVEPLAFLQQQLGHASIVTTMIYLHIVDSAAEDAVLLYSDEIDAISSLEGIESRNG